MALIGQREIVDRLNVAGDIAVLFAQSRRALRGEPPLTAAEVMETLRLLPGERRNRKFDLLRSLLERCGRLEAYFLAKLLLRKAGFGFDYQGEVLSRALARHYQAAEEAVAHAMALTDAFHVARVLEARGRGRAARDPAPAAHAGAPGARGRHHRRDRSLPGVGRAQVRRHPPDAAQGHRRGRLGARRGLHPRPPRLARAGARARPHHPRAPRPLGDPRRRAARHRRRSRGRAPGHRLRGVRLPPGRPPPAGDAQVRRVRSRLPRRPRPDAALARRAAPPPRRAARGGDAPAPARAPVHVRGPARAEPRGRQSPLLPLPRPGLRGHHHQGSRAAPTASPSATPPGASASRR